MSPWVWTGLALILAGGDATALPKLHTVPVGIHSNRLLGMSQDDQGGIWCGSFLRRIHRYDPATGAIATVQLPYDATASACLCAGQKVYILGQTYPRLMIYDRTSKTFCEAKYPTKKPEVWYGTEAFDRRHLYLFDRGPGGGIIQWDTTTDTGKAVAYPFKTPRPNAGRHVPGDRALWCTVHDFEKGQYVPLGITRFDLRKEEFTDYFAFPKENAELPPYAGGGNTLFFPWTLKGKIVPFDVTQRRWRRPLEVPEYGKRFGFIGLATVHQGRWYFSISTYNGTNLGCDGKPYHFCNALLVFDPKTARFSFTTLEAPDAYYQVSYTLSAGGQLYATGSNIRQPDGRLDSARRGEIVFWTTRRPDRPPDTR